MKRSRRTFLVGLPAALVATQASSVLAGPRIRSTGSRTQPRSRGLSRKRIATPKPMRVDARMLRRAEKHVLRPSHVAAVRCDTGVSAARQRIVELGKFSGKVIAVKPRLNVQKLGPALHAELGTSATGYAWQLRKYGAPAGSGVWQWGQTPADAGQGWNHDTRMHIASVSKLITAIATANLLHALDLSYDERIVEYLPVYWNKGPKIGDITFRDLLTHRSGFRTGGSASDFGVMKAKVAGGVSRTHGSYDYENLNFGLCRILIPNLAGWLDTADTYGNLSDPVWDILTTSRFLEYCHHHVFHPSGVGNVTFDPVGRRALAYRVPHAGVAGWSSGDLTSVSGGAGFRMSVNEVLNVMGTFRRAGSIVPVAEVPDFLDSMLGLDQRIETPAGIIYNKNGAWGDSATNTRLEQCVAFFLPDGMELVVFVNSPIAGNKSLRDAVTQSYVASLE